MNIQLTPTEQKLIDHARMSVAKYNKQRHARGGIDTLYGFLITKEGFIPISVRTQSRSLEIA